MQNLRSLIKKRALIAVLVEQQLLIYMIMMTKE